MRPTWCYYAAPSVLGVYHTKRHDLLNAKGEPNFGATMYALRKDGVYGSATMRGGDSFAVHDGTEARKEKCAALFE